MVSTPGALVIISLIYSGFTLITVAKAEDSKNVTTTAPNISSTDFAKVVQPKLAELAEFRPRGLFDEMRLSLLDTISPKVLNGELDGISVSSLNHTRRLPFLLHSRNAAIISIDYHWNKSLVFFSNKSVIFRVSAVGSTVVSTPVVLITEGLWLPMLAVDWVHDRLYWMSSHWQTIESADLDGGNRRLLIDNIRAFKYPNNIAVDPYDGRIFFVSNFSVFTCDLEGANVKRFILENNNPGQLKNGVRSLALDRKTKKLYTSRKHVSNLEQPNTTNSYIDCTNYDGGSHNLINYGYIKFNDIFSMDILYDTLVFADIAKNQTEAVYKLNLTMGDDAIPRKQFVTNNTSSELFSIRIFHPCVQSPADEPNCTLQKNRI